MEKQSVPPRLRKFRIHHILDAFDKIERYTVDLSKASSPSHDMAVDAVIRNLQVIGEATRHVPEDVQERYADVPWAKMRGMRNVVTHDYDGVRLDIV